MPSKVQVEYRQAQIGPATIAYQVAGNGAPIVLIHGLSGSSRWWARNVKPLAERFQVYIVDLIGFGASRSGPRFVLDQAASYVARWMKQIGIERAGMVGHSMGGYIAAELVADHPEQVERLVLVDAAALPLGQSIAQHGLSLLREVGHMRPSFLPTLFYDALRAGPATLWDAVHDLLHADLRPKLARITVPTLVIWGEHDALVPLATGKDLARHTPNKELLVIKNAGHTPMWDCPRVFNHEVGAFLAGERRPAALSEIECTLAPQAAATRRIQKHSVAH